VFNLVEVAALIWVLKLKVGSHLPAALAAQ
jgi:hypothetical protein